MIDIHNHIVFDVDDGAPTLEKSLSMLKAASDAGITHVCFTPHYMEDGYQTSLTELQYKVSIIQEALGEQNIPVEVSLGEEVFIFPELDKSLGKCTTLNGSRYLLFELPLMEEVNYVYDVVYKLVSAGYVPILAHPERYLKVQQDFNLILELLKRGVLMQINASSLVGNYGTDAKKVAVRMLESNMVYFIASDAHASHHYQKYQKGLQMAEKLVGKNKVNELTEVNPYKALNDEAIPFKQYSLKPQRMSLVKMLLGR